MRLLGCFTKKTVIINQPTEDRSSHYPDRFDHDHQNLLDAPVSHASSSPPRHQASTLTAFTPTSIPELHPEYAHSEPYCFVARTESARIVVDRLRGARGQPAIDHANILKQQGVTVVRGPTASSPLKPHVQPVDTQEIYASAQSPVSSLHLSQHHNASPLPPLRSPSHALKVEVPTTTGTYIDSEEENGDENVDVNLQTRLRAFSDAELLNKDARSMSDASKPGASPGGRTCSKRSTPGKSFRLKSKSARKSKPKAPKRSATMPSIPRKPSVDSSVGDSSLADREQSDIPSAPREKNRLERQLSFEKLIEKHMDNTPRELLAPIMVPRTSVVFGENFNPSTASSQRYADVEGDNSSSLLPTVGISGVVHKAQTRAARDTGGSPRKKEATSPVTHNLRSRRKSKPFLSPNCDASVRAGPGAQLAALPIPSLDSPVRVGTPGGTTSVKLSPIPAPAPLSREPSLGMLSDEVTEGDESSTGDDGDDDKQYTRAFGGRSELFPVTSPSAQAASRQRVESNIGLMDLPRVGGAMRSMARRASTANKRKTVSFHDAAPIVIEPNLRAPSLSVPRSATLAKENVKGSIGGALSLARDSVTLSSHMAPLVDVDGDDVDNEEDDDEEESDDMEDALDHGFGVDAMEERHGQAELGSQDSNGMWKIASTNNGLVDRSREDRQRSDMSMTSQGSLDRPSWQRSSRRISVKDKQAIREATRRQSMAVAQAMSQQIRGVPKSAMLAFSQNEVIVEHEEEDDGTELDSEDSSSKELWIRRRSRASKSIRVPEIKPGEIPLPPPPPPFSPIQLVTRSLQMPPPPPSSPLSH